MKQFFDAWSGVKENFACVFTQKTNIAMVHGVKVIIYE